MLNLRPEFLATLRATIGYLGEREQFAWWQSSFFDQGSSAFLTPVFARTHVLAQVAGVTRAAALVHDKWIGVGDAYHLFRMPEDVEQAIHRALHQPARPEQRCFARLERMGGTWLDGRAQHDTRGGEHARTWPGARIPFSPGVSLRSPPATCWHPSGVLGDGGHQ